ncbi:MAG: glycosyltransferase [Alphaproteobacteria bacterium]
MSPGAAALPAARYRARDPSRPIFGLTSATESFVEAYLRWCAPARVTALTRTEADFEALRARGPAGGFDPGRLVRAGIGDHRALARCGALLHLDPMMAGAARARPDPRAYSLIGLTHSLSSRESWREIQAYPSAPLQPWDAVVCTSTVARGLVDALLDAVDESARRAGLPTPAPRPERPLIPLGIDAPALARDPARRARWRTTHGRAEDECVILCLGRLSMHAKAHPFAMFAAVAAAAPGRKLALALLGQAATPAIAAVYREAAVQVAAPVPVIFLDGPTEDDRADALSGADAFISLADSVQETFGLAPVEAMAAGLPAIVTDWNGYRDTVRDGVDGFRIPTLMAAPPAAEGLAEHYIADRLDYDRFCAALGQLVAVDVGATVRAIEALDDPERRRSMGAAATALARAIYDWPVVLGAYRALWQALGERRRAGRRAAPVAAPPPPPPDPMRLFADFPTRRLDDGDGIAFLRPGAGATLAAAARDPMFRHAFPLLPAPRTIAAILDLISARPGVTVAALAESADPSARPAVLRLVLLLAKRDLVTVTPAGGAA